MGSVAQVLAMAVNFQWGTLVVGGHNCSNDVHHKIPYHPNEYLRVKRGDYLFWS